MSGQAVGTQAGLQDFWNTYDAHYDEIIAETLRAVHDHSEFGPVMRAIPIDQMAAQNRGSRELLKSANFGLLATASKNSKPSMTGIIRSSRMTAGG